MWLEQLWALRSQLNPFYLLLTYFDYADLFLLVCFSLRLAHSCPVCLDIFAAVKFRVISLY